MKQNGGFLIFQIKQRSDRIFDRTLAARGIDAFNGAQGRILYVLWQDAPLSIGELSRRSGLAATTLTGMLDRMESAGLLRRVPDPRDRRRTLLEPTERAQALKEDYTDVSDGVSELFYRGFSPAETERFEAYLQRVLRNLEQADDGPLRPGKEEDHGERGDQ